MMLHICVLFIASLTLAASLRTGSSWSVRNTIRTKRWIWGGILPVRTHHQQLNNNYGCYERLCATDGYPEPPAGFGNVPKAPQAEEEIQDETFEGYLRDQWRHLACWDESSGKPARDVDFDTFFAWRQKQGLLFAKEEIFELWNSLVGEEEEGGVKVMDFINMNKIIDESNEADI